MTGVPNFELRIAGRAGAAIIDRLPDGPAGVPLVRCSGTIDDEVFVGVYDQVSQDCTGDRLVLVVDVRAADMVVGFDGYARAARLVRRRGIEEVFALVCDQDAARVLDAKVGQEMAAVHGLRIVQRVIGRLEDAPAILAGLEARHRR